MSLLGRSEIQRLERDVREARARAERAEIDLDLLVGVIGQVAPGVAVTAADGRSLVRSAAMVEGHGELLVQEAVAAVLASAAGGERAERRIDLIGPPPRTIVVRGAPVADGATVAIVEDHTERVRLDSVRTDFVANISHELKTPVGALAVLAEALAENDDAESNRKLAEKMVYEAHRVSSTIDELLELSRIELGGPVEREEVLVAAVLGEVLARNRFSAETAGVALQIPSTNGSTVVGDHLQLVSAISNLVDNAIKYSERGGSVVVEAKFVEGWLEVSVTDRGVGIPSRDLDRIFERFYRVDRARSRATGGVGLGLSIVRHVAANHGGEVTVQSKEGEGSTFVLRIPIGLED